MGAAEADWNEVTEEIQRRKEEDEKEKERSITAEGESHSILNLERTAESSWPKSSHHP